MEREALNLNRGTAVILATACVAMAISAISCGGGGSVNVAATASAPTTSLSPTSLTFTSQAVGSTTSAQTITLTNSGNADLSITGITVSGANASDFTQMNNCGSSVAAGANCTISATFKPAATGTRTAAVTLGDNAGGSPQTVALSGAIATSLAIVSPSSLSLGNQPLSATSPVQAITLTNSGNADLSVNSVAVSGANAGDFSQSNDCGNSVAAGANCTISVTFKPAAAGSRTAAIVVADSAPNSPQTVALSGTGDAPVASLSSSNVAFGNQSVSTASTAQAVTLTNSGNSALSITSIAVFGTNASDFAQTNNCGISVAAGANCTINIIFTPATGGSRGAALAITDNAAGSPQSVSLSGTGISTIANVSPSSLTFGNQSVGATSSAQAVTLTNSGNSALSITSIAVFGTNVSDFAQTNNCGISVAAGANCTISVTFTPTAAGSRAASLSITDNSTGSPQAVSLSGTGISTAVNVSPSSLAFGNQPVATASTAQAVTLTNSGNSALSIISISVLGTNASDFAQTNNCGSSVTAGANCTIIVTFTPSVAGSRAAALAITDNATGSPQSVRLTGTGTAPAVSISPTGLTFASQVVGTTSSSQVVTLNNPGNAALSITSIAFTGANATDFTQVDTCGASVAAGGNCTIAVMFTPSATGPRVASLGITDNASGSPQPISLSGAGTQPGPTGSTYYVDNCVVIGSDENNGTSPTTPWLTVHKVNTSSFNPGDSILFESTCTWREQLTVPSSGSAGSPITFGADGTGAQPIISGADLLTSWASETPLYYAHATAQPNQVFLDNQRLNLAASKAALATGEWWWDSTNNRVYVYDDPSGHTMEASQRNYGINTNGRSYLTINSLSLQNTNANGLFFGGNTQNVTLQNSEVSYAYGVGVRNQSSSNLTATLITQNAIHHNGASGIYLLTSGVANNTVSNNSLYYNSQVFVASGDWQESGGIYLWTTGTGNVIDGNLVYRNGYNNDNSVVSSTQALGSGIWFDTVASGNVISHNFVYSNNFDGLRFEDTSGCLMYDNVAYSNGTAANTEAGITIRSYNQIAPSSGNSVFANTLYGNYYGIELYGYSNGAPGKFTNNLFENNIVIGSGYALLAQYGAENDGTMGSGNVYTYNSFGTAAGNFIKWGSSNYSTYATWEAATGNCGTTGCSHSTQTNPTFANASSGQFWLTGGSPGIDAGTNLGSPYNIGLLPGSSWPNSVLTGDQNSYGTGWEVGAFIFTGQTVQ